MQQATQCAFSLHTFLGEYKKSESTGHADVQPFFCGANESGLCGGESGATRTPEEVISSRAR